MDTQKTASNDCVQNGPDMTQSGPKVTRLRISKPQHQAVLKSVANQLGSDKPIDGLEHILNCWLVGNIPPVASATPMMTPIAEPESEDEFSALMEF